MGMGKKKSLHLGGFAFNSGGLEESDLVFLYYLKINYLHVKKKHHLFAGNLVILVQK